MTIQILDHLAFILVACLFPLYDFFTMRRYQRRIEAGHNELRLKLYRDTILEEWGLALAILALWFGLGRNFDLLGLGLEYSRGSGWGYGLTLLLSIFWIAQLWIVSGNPEHRERVREKVESQPFSYMFPQTPSELRGFLLMSVTAGICEEILYRGFLIAYLMPVLGIGFWPAGVIACAFFGLIHTYQGLAGIVRTSLIGLFMTVLYGLTGGLWAPILFHILIDVVSGGMAYLSTRESE